MESSGRFLIGLGLCVAAFCAQRFQVPAPEQEDKESYGIYSTVLQVMHADVTAWTIIRETRSFKFCATPARDQDALYRPILDDYIRKNKKTVPLERKFTLANYVLTAPEEWTRSTNRKIIAAFSAVGFNIERTRAAVCFWADSSGTCSVLLKSDGAWQSDKGWRGDGCGWAY